MERLTNTETTLYAIIDSEWPMVSSTVINETDTHKRDYVPTATIVTDVECRSEIPQQIRIPMAVLLTCKFTAFPLETLKRDTVTNDRRMQFTGAVL